MRESPNNFYSIFNQNWVMPELRVSEEPKRQEDSNSRDAIVRADLTSTL